MKSITGKTIPRGITPKEADLKYGVLRDRMLPLECPQCSAKRIITATGLVCGCGAKTVSINSRERTRLRKFRDQISVSPADAPAQKGP